MKLDTRKVLLRSRVFILLLRGQEKDRTLPLERKGLIFDAASPETLTTESDFSQQIKAYRESHGLTQRNLAFKTGIDHSTINRLESSKRDPKASTVFALSTGLDLNAEQTIGLLESVYQEHRRFFSPVLPKQKTGGE